MNILYFAYLLYFFLLLSTWRTLALLTIKWLYSLSRSRHKALLVINIFCFGGGYQLFSFEKGVITILIVLAYNILLIYLIHIDAFYLRYFNKFIFWFAVVCALCKLTYKCTIEVILQTSLALFTWTYSCVDHCFTGLNLDFFALLKNLLCFFLILGKYLWIGILPFWLLFLSLCSSFSLCHLDDRTDSSVSSNSSCCCLSSRATIASGTSDDLLGFEEGLHVGLCVDFMRLGVNVLVEKLVNHLLIFILASALNLINWLLFFGLRKRTNYQLLKDLFYFWIVLSSLIYLLSHFLQNKFNELRTRQFRNLTLLTINLNFTWCVLSHNIYNINLITSLWLFKWFEAGVFRLVDRADVGKTCNFVNEMRFYLIEIFHSVD